MSSQYFIPSHISIQTHIIYYLIKTAQEQQLNKPYCTYGSEDAGCLTNCNNNQLTTLPYTQMETISDFCSSLFSAKYPWKFSRLPLLMKIELSTFEFVNHARSNAYIVVAAIVFLIYMKHITLIHNLKIQQTIQIQRFNGSLIIIVLTIDVILT